MLTSQATRQALSASVEHLTARSVQARSHPGWRPCSLAAGLVQSTESFVVEPREQGTIQGIAPFQNMVESLSPERQNLVAIGRLGLIG